MLVRHGSHCVKVRNIGVRVAESLGIHHLSIGLNSSIEGIEVVHVENGERNALRCQRVRNQVERTAVEVIGSHDVVARSEEILQSIGHSRRAARHSQGSHAALQGRHALLEDRLSGISEAAIDIARITQRKAVGCMLRIAEHVRSSLIDRHGACIGGGVGLLLPHVQLQRLEM